MADGNHSSQPGDAPAPHGGPPLSEWVVAAIGAVLLLAALVFLLHAATTRGDGPPAPHVEVLRTLPQPPGRWVVQFRVRNASATPAGSLKVSGALRQGGQELERRETEFQFLPGRSEREGALVFTRDPQAAALELQVESWQAP